MYFDFDFSLPTILLLSLSLLAALYVGIVYCARVWTVGKMQRQADKAEDVPTEYPSVSVIVYAHSDPDDLSHTLPLIMQQDYPGSFEAIVVNEGMSAEVNMAVALVKAKYPNIYLTFTPDEARNLSRRKLGLTLGVKAAKGSIVVMTDARAEVASDQWLRLMAAPFAEREETEVVLGYGYPRVPDSSGIRVKCRAFDMAADAVTWISAAKHGHPYRGCAYNLAYRRKLFFEAKGFAESINMKDGDDDAFISAIATPDNTRLQLASRAMASLRATPFMRLTADDRKSHAFTGRKLYKGSRRIMAFGEWCIWLSASAAIGGAVGAGVGNMAGWTVAAFIILATMLSVGIVWCRALKALRTPAIAVSLPFIAAMRPLRNILTGIASRTSHRHYIWE